MYSEYWMIEINEVGQIIYEAPAPFLLQRRKGAAATRITLRLDEK